MRRGFLLMEASVSYLVLALALVTLVPVFIISIRAAKNSEQIAAATWLSAELLEEIRLRKWDEATPLPPRNIGAPGPLGVETGENALDKRTFDDLDDFDGWTEAPPSGPVMNALPGFSAYTRSVTVEYLDASLAVSATPTDYKQISVCTSAVKLKPVCLTTTATNR